MRFLILLLCITVCGITICGCGKTDTKSNASTFKAKLAPRKVELTLLQERKKFKTKIIREDQQPRVAVDVPPKGCGFDLIKYQSPVGKLAAYVTSKPKDGKKHPAIIWITGGDNNTIGDVWSPNHASNDQSASAIRKAGIVMMFPSQRGGNENPGKREGFLGEVDDILAAADHLAALDYVDADQIYLGGHSTGGTIVMLVAECSDRFRAVFSLGPVADSTQYGGDYLYCDLNNRMETKLRSPIEWLHNVTTPLYVFEGANDGNWGAIQLMQNANSNPKIQFHKVEGYDHFSVIAPLAKLIAEQIIQGKIKINDDVVEKL